jgi:small subunit ribosomal protein S8
MTDPISDMIIRIINAQAVSHPTVSVPFSDFKYEIAKILEKEGFLNKVEEKGKKVKKLIEITLKYNDKIPAISGLRRISKPGQRIYSEAKEIKKVKGGYGMSIISTPSGLMTNKEARKKKIGGEIILEIW